MKILYLAFVKLDVPNASGTYVVEAVHHLAWLIHKFVVILPGQLQLIQVIKRSIDHFGLS